jgi:hypothetical protein
MRMTHEPQWQPGEDWRLAIVVSLSPSLQEDSDLEITYRMLGS